MGGGNFDQSAATACVWHGRGGRIARSIQKEGPLTGPSFCIGWMAWEAGCQWARRVCSTHRAANGVHSAPYTVDRYVTTARARTARSHSITAPDKRNAREWAFLDLPGKIC